MKTALEEAQANLSIAANRAKAYADASRRKEKYEVGNEVVLQRDTFALMSICQ